MLENSKTFIHYLQNSQIIQKFIPADLLESKNFNFRRKAKGSKKGNQKNIAQVHYLDGSASLVLMRSAA